MTLRRILWALLALLALAGAGAYLMRAPLSVALATRLAAARLAADPIAELPDGLHVGTCGAGSPFPDDRRSGPCTLVIAGKRVFVFDAGSGAVRNLGKMGVNHGRIEAIFLTHLHSDHIDGLGELLLQRWVAGGNPAPVPVHGPTGVDVVVGGLMQAYAPDRQYRVAHHGEAVVPPGGFGGHARPFEVGPDDAVVLLKDGDLEIAAFGVDHSPVKPAAGYRIRYKDRSAVLSGDTRKSASVQREAAGADLLVHEALSAPLVGVLQEGAQRAGRPNLVRIFADVIDYHTSPEQAAEIARDAKVRFLLLNHVVPPLPLPGMEKAFLAGAADVFSGPIRVAADGDLVSLPAGSREVSASRRF